MRVQQTYLSRLPTSASKSSPAYIRNLPSADSRSDPWRSETDNFSDQYHYVVQNRFIESPNRNLKAAGIIALSALVQIDSSYVAVHQLAVIDCLNDSDETLRTEALKLLTQTTNSSNAAAVVQKLLESAT